MATSSLATEAAAAKHVKVTEHALVVELRDGRSVSVPIDWYPRLAEGRPSERRRWELIGPGIGIHWPDLDEDISVEGLLLGLPSGESAASWNDGEQLADARLTNEWSRRAPDRESARLIRNVSRAQTSGLTVRTLHARSRMMPQHPLFDELDASLSANVFTGRAAQREALGGRQKATAATD